MTKSKTALFALVALLVIAGCNKTALLVYTGSKVHTQKDCRKSVTYTYNYNSDGSIASQLASNGEKTLYTYIGDSVLMEKFNSSNVITDGALYFVNSRKLADTSYGFQLSQNVANSYSYTTIFMPLEKRNYSFGVLRTIDKYNLLGTNISSVEHYNVANNTSTFDAYDYYASDLNTLGNQSMGMDFLGVQNANLYRDNVQINANGDTTDIINYRYRFNVNSLPDTVATYRKSTGALVDSFIYTYY